MTNGDYHIDHLDSVVGIAGTMSSRYLVVSRAIHWFFTHT